MNTKGKDFYCECGQFLNTYFEVVGKCSPNRDTKFVGLPCPAKGCTRTYTMEKKADGEPFKEGELEPKLMVGPFTETPVVAVGREMTFTDKPSLLTVPMGTKRGGK